MHMVRCTLSPALCTEPAGVWWLNKKACGQVTKSHWLVQCFVFPTVLWHCWLSDGQEGHVAHKKPVPLIPKGCLPEQMKEENWGNSWKIAIKMEVGCVPYWNGKWVLWLHLLSVFSCAMIASTDISCRRISVCLSVCHKLVFYWKG